MAIGKMEHVQKTPTKKCKGFETTNDEVEISGLKKNLEGTCVKGYHMEVEMDVFYVSLEDKTRTSG